MYFTIRFVNSDMHNCDVLEFQYRSVFQQKPPLTITAMSKNCLLDKLADKFKPLIYTEICNGLDDVFDAWLSDDQRTPVYRYNLFSGYNPLRAEYRKKLQ